MDDLKQDTLDTKTVPAETLSAAGLAASNGTATGSKYWWSCPACGEINASPADKRPENIVGCRCGWEGQWCKAVVKLRIEP